MKAKKKKISKWHFLLIKIPKKDWKLLRKLGKRKETTATGLIRKAIKMLLRKEKVK